MLRLLIAISLVLSFALQALCLDIEKQVDDPVHKSALLLGRMSRQLTPQESNKIIHALAGSGHIGKTLEEKWEQLKYATQLLFLIANNRHFFTTGYEFELANEDVLAFGSDFKLGTKQISKVVKGTFGLEWENNYQFKYVMKDDFSDKWSIVPEYVWDDIEEYGEGRDGWELVSPAFRNPDQLRMLMAFLLRLGNNPYGQQGDFTGNHQTFDLLPQGVKGDKYLVGRVAANLMLIQEQFLPALYEILEIKRYGAYRNFFTRPLLFDHLELLKDLQSAGDKLSTSYIYDLMNNKHFEKEYVFQVNNSPVFDEEDKEDYLRKPEEKRRQFKNVWKYRDLKIRFNEEKPWRTMVEARIGDYKSANPEIMLKLTYLYHRMIGLAYDMALKNQIWQLNVPVRNENQKITEYWQKLKAWRPSSDEAFFKTLGLSENESKFLLGHRSQPIKRKYSAGSRISFGFEFEGWSEKLVRFIMPADPNARSNWQKLSDNGKVKFLKSHGFDLENDFSWQMFKKLTTEYYVDIAKFPFLDMETHLEESGNWEIKSNGRDLTDINELESSLREVARNITIEEGFGVHLHVFIPKRIVDEIRERKLSGQFVDYLERTSLFMLLSDYRESSSRWPWHALDSWSLDRYSPKDLEQILAWLEGRAQLDNLTQKYHNIGFRVVDGGLDIEFRDIDDDIEHGLKLVRRLTKSLEKMEFGGIDFHENPAIFHEFRDFLNRKDAVPYTLTNAMSKRYQLSERQLGLLRKLQFEIYKPSMPEYMAFPPLAYATNTVPSDLLDTQHVRANYETNMALPLLNYETQSFLNLKQKTQIAKAREEYLAKVYQLIQKIEKDPNYRFIFQFDNFLHLADYLERSTHPSKPAMNLVRGDEAERQYEVLEDLTYKMRSLAVQFVKDTKLDQMVERSLENKKSITDFFSHSHPASLAKQNSCSGVFAR